MLSFNRWLTQLQHDDNTITALADRWAVTRGRITTLAVEERALKLGFPPGYGTRAHDIYLSQVTPTKE
jgi:hypothetical protein